MPVTNKSAPVQSMCRSRSASGKPESLASERTKHSAATSPMTQKGKLMWKHQRHEALSTSEPPSTGPMMLPMDQEPSTREKYWGRCLKGTMSQKMTWVMAMMPPPPMPCMQRPMSMTAKSCATAQKAVPKVKRRMDARSSRWRPKQEEAAATTGWKTADARRYEVPVQKVSAADPLSERDISYTQYVKSAIGCELSMRSSSPAAPSPGW